MANPNGHDWAFAAAGMADTVHAVAICNRCGLIRTETAQATSASDRRLNLEGQCPDLEPEQLEERLGQI